MSDKIKLKLFCVTADYRPKGDHNPQYYVAARTKRGAKKAFEKAYSWLKVYNVEEITNPEVGRSIMNSNRSPCIFSKE